MCDTDDELELKDLVYSKLENTALFRNIRVSYKEYKNQKNKIATRYLLGYNSIFVGTTQSTYISPN